MSADHKERQLFDMNCNDCKHLVRSFVKRQEHEDMHYDAQKSLFNTRRLKMLSKVEEHYKKGNIESAKQVMKDVNKMDFVFSKASISLSFASCGIKAKKGVFSFIPNTIMEENINCFKHRIEE